MYTNVIRKVFLQKKTVAPVTFLEEFVGNRVALATTSKLSHASKKCPSVHNIRSL